jgi:hypothetical protein
MYMPRDGDGGAAGAGQYVVASVQTAVLLLEAVRRACHGRKDIFWPGRRAGAFVGDFATYRSRRLVSKLPVQTFAA